MKRNPQVILESLLSIFIIIDLLLVGLMIIGFTVGLKQPSIYNIGNFDLILSFLILLDFIFFRVRNKKTNEINWLSLRNNWIYLVAIVPITFFSFNIFHLFDFTIIIGLIGILKLYAMYNVLLITSREVRKYPSKTKLDYATVVLLLVLIIGSYLFFIVERSVNPEVLNYESSIWFSIASMTTTGYGDIVPVTGIGRLIGVILILSGMGYVSLVTATLAYSFIDLFRKESRKAAERVEKRAIGYEEKIDKLTAKIDEMDRKIDEMEIKK